MPYSMFCPVSLIIAKALSDDAFDPSFGSVQALFDRPIFGNTACVDLVWKKEIMDQEIFPMSYSSFYELWNRVHVVAGYSEKVRPYSLRVGAGSRLDGKSNRSIHSLRFSTS